MIHLLSPALLQLGPISNKYPFSVLNCRALPPAKAYIRVNEEGTEAEAPTAIGMVTTATILSPVCKLNHPFLYSIIEKQTGPVLFL